MNGAFTALQMHQSGQESDWWGRGTAGVYGNCACPQFVVNPQLSEEKSYLFKKLTSFKP